MTQERYIGIDNVCAWPNLTRLSDGRIVATIFNQPTHGGWEGEVECWSSSDEGRTWTFGGVPSPHAPGTNRMNVAVGCAREGDLIVLVGGWTQRNPVGRYSSPHEGELLPIDVCRSPDGGATWTRDTPIPFPSGEKATLVPYGDIVSLPDGSLGACLYGGSGPADRRIRSSYFYRSTDDGHTWAMHGTIQAEDLVETTPLVLPDGRILAVGRTFVDQHLEMFSSDDGGRSWTNAGHVTLAFQHPGHLLALSDGRILLSFSTRNKGLHGIAARLSEDQGKTWEPLQMVLSYEMNTDGGYPSTVESQEGKLITAYYCKSVPFHHRYHMGVVLWPVPDPEQED